MSNEDYLFAQGDVALQLIPKCGSTAVRDVLTECKEIYPSEGLTMPIRLTVLRNPLARLLSVFTYSVTDDRLRALYPYSQPEEFIDAFLDTPPLERERHTLEFREVVCDGEYWRRSTKVPIEEWPKVADAYGLPLLAETSPNQSHPWLKRMMPCWSMKQTRRLLTDDTLMKDLSIWSMALYTWK